MSSAIQVDLFVEDSAHEELLRALVRRIAREEGIAVRPRVRSATGGHPRALSEFRLYQRSADLLESAGGPADLVVVAIDGNCSSFPEARKRILDAAGPAIRERVVAACPDPHVEKWYLADLQSFKEVIGRGPEAVEDKCERHHYKRILKTAIRQAGHPPSDGVDFAAELAAAMDFYRAGKDAPSLKAFFDDFRARLRICAPSARTCSSPSSSGGGR